MRHPAVVVECTAAHLLEGEVEREAALASLFAQVATLRKQEVLFQGYGYQGPLLVPTFSVGGVEFTPTASECFCSTSSPIAPVDGGLTRYFGWELLDELALLSLKGGITFSGARARP